MFNIVIWGNTIYCAGDTVLLNSDKNWKNDYKK